MIIDTNVLVAADGNATHASEHCAIRCRQVIADARRTVVALDDGGEVLAEYFRNVPADRPLSSTFLFVDWLRSQQYDPSRVERVEIPHDVATAEPPLGEPTLVGFDPSDRKFVAVALGANSQHPIKQALDSKWVSFDSRLAELGVTVDWVCPSIIGPAVPSSAKDG